MQREMPFLAPCKPPQNAPEALVRRIESDAQAVAVSLAACGLKASYVAAALGRSPAWLSRVKGGELAMSDAQAERFCAVTGSRLLIQVRALREALAEIRGQMDAAETIRRFAAELRRTA
jgi:hypothetical protein